MSPSGPRTHEPHAGAASARALGAALLSGGGLLAPEPTPQSPEEQMLARRTELVLRELDQLPTLPAVATRILELGAREDVQIHEIVRVIESDPTLTMRLLALCRRAAYRTRTPITTVEMAVVMLGVDAVRSLVLSVEIFDWTGNTTDRRRQAAASGGSALGRASTRPGGSRDPEKPAFGRVGFWQHSIAVACAADLIAREHPGLGLHPDECFVCGLIHDLGKIGLDLVLPRAYARVVELAEARQGNIADFERPILGVDHLLAGKTLAERWGLPPLLADAMSLHNLPPARLPDVPHRLTIAVVHIADVICRKLALGWSGNFDVGGGEIELCEQAGLDAKKTVAVVPKLYEATTKRMRDLGLGDDPSQQLLIESILRANQRLGRANQDLVEANIKLERAQKELTETRAMARLGQMTAGAAHEMNNPLAVISGRAQSLLEKLRDEADKSSGRAIIDAATRLTDLITRLNRVAAPPQFAPEVIDLRDVLEDAIRIAKDGHAKRAAGATASGPNRGLVVLGVKLTIAEGLLTARLDRALVCDALVEIIVNALESGPRGRIEVRVDPDPADDRLRIRVVDDGVGMSDLALTHATDPFFSEKPAGRQTGLGLALAHRFVGACGGDIELESKSGRGTTVTLRFPGWRPEDKAASPAVRPALKAA